jgi:hypothetical protein
MTFQIPRMIHLNQLNKTRVRAATVSHSNFLVAERLS